MALGPFGEIAIAEIILYVPVACISFFVAWKHGFGRRLGWLFLFTFAMFRFVGAVFTVVYRSMANPATGIVVAATVLTGVGLSPLLLATHAFVSGITASISHPLFRRPLTVARLLLVVGLILGAVGGSDQSPLNPASTRNAGKALTGIGIVLFLIVYVFLFLVHVILWRERDEIEPNFRKLLSAISLALPPLFVRIIYGFLSDFGSASKFSPVTGEWQFFLFMGLLMEYLVVIIYLVTGLTIPTRKEESLAYPMS